MTPVYRRAKREHNTPVYFECALRVSAPAAAVEDRGQGRREGGGTERVSLSLECKTLRVFNMPSLPPGCGANRAFTIGLQ